MSLPSRVTYTQVSRPMLGNMGAPSRLWRLELNGPSGAPCMRSPERSHQQSVGAPPFVGGGPKRPPWGGQNAPPFFGQSYLSCPEADDLPMVPAVSVPLVGLTVVAEGSGSKDDHERGKARKSAHGEGRNKLDFWARKRERSPRSRVCPHSSDSATDASRPKPARESVNFVARF